MPADIKYLLMFFLYVILDTTVVSSISIIDAINFERQCKIMKRNLSLISLKICTFITQKLKKNNLYNWGLKLFIH